MNLDHCTNILRSLNPTKHQYILHHIHPTREGSRRAVRVKTQKENMDLICPMHVVVLPVSLTKATSSLGLHRPSECFPVIRRHPILPLRSLSSLRPPSRSFSVAAAAAFDFKADQGMIEWPGSMMLNSKSVTMNWTSSEL